MAPFRPSLRDVVTRLTLLAASTWFLLRLAAQLDVRLTTVMTVGALAVMFAVRLGLQRPTTELLPEPDALRVRSPEGERTIPWAVMDGLRLTAGDIPTPRGDVRVCYAQVDIAHGPPLAFADLSSLGSPRLRTAEGDAPVHDVGDPEILFGTIAERLDAREFLPAGTAEPEDPKGPWWSASPSATLRLATGALLVSRSVALLWGNDAWMAALAGAGAVAAPHALVRFLTQRRAGPSQSEVGAPPALVASSLAAVTLALLADRGVPALVSAWAVSAAMMLALPVWPMPAGYAARRLGRWLSLASDGALAGLVTIHGVLCAWLFAKGMVVLPTALVAGALEVSEGLLASRRHAWLSALPRFRATSPEALARLRAVLRPLAPGETVAHTGPGDLLELRRALSPPPAAGLSVMVAAALSVGLLAVTLRALLHGPDADVARVVRVILT
ncbi:MAG: hypothetical protein HY909_11455 [Deltaproteobacteria bacterium]|nr:hypothetical protein [Deltaproteobacteria bacterium]